MTLAMCILDCCTISLTLRGVYSVKKALKDHRRKLQQSQYALRSIKNRDQNDRAVS